MNTTIVRTGRDPVTEYGLTPNPLATAGLAESADSTLHQAIQAGVDAVNPRTLIRVAPTDAEPALQPRALLASIVYCYARQIYASADIEALLAGGEASEDGGPGARPDAQVIREFRCKNRQAIHRGLATALLEMARQKVRNGIVTRVRDALAAEEASRRIIMAMFADSLSENDA